MKKRRTLILVLAVALVSVLSVGATLAWFYDTDEATNTFTVGNVAIELTEPGWDEEVANENNLNVYPSKILKKDPKVTNTGVNPCWVRIKVEWPDLPGEGDITYLTGCCSVLGPGWFKVGSYYYYIWALDSGESTSALFEKIQMPYGMTNGDPVDFKDIIVTAQAVQAEFDFCIGGRAAAETDATTVPAEELQMFENAFGEDVVNK